MQRDPIYAALLNQLTVLKTPPYLISVPNVAPYLIQTVSRGFVPYEECDLQPAVFIVPLTEETISKKGLPNKYLFKLDLFVYVKWIDQVSQGVTALAIVMDMIDLVLSPVGPNGGMHGDNGFTNNLGGLAQWCALQGTAEISGGFLNKLQCVARMPLEIMVA